MTLATTRRPHGIKRRLGPQHVDMGMDAMPWPDSTPVSFFDLDQRAAGGASAGHGQK